MSLFEELKRRNVFRVGIAYTVSAWLILQVADIVLDNIPAPDWVMQVIMVLLAIGLPVALLFAWAFELTPEGIKKEKDVDRTQSITRHTGRKLDYAIIAILAVALGYFIWESRFDSGSGADSIDTAAPQKTAAAGSSESQPGHSIAVLPFVDMSPAKDNEYFTDGLTEELLNILAQIKSLQVAGRTSSFAFKGKTEDLRDIGQKLNVNTLLEGSVRKDDARQKIRVTVQLINVEDGYHLWSDTYDRDLEDVFAIQEDIARQVADALKVTLLGEDAARIAGHTQTELNAYDLYLQGLRGFNTYSFESLRESERLLLAALERDPDYQPAQLALARTLVAMATTGAMPLTEATEKVNPILNRVLRADPGNSDAHSYRGELQAANRQMDAAQQSFEQALDSNPRNVSALTFFGRFLVNRGHIEDGLDYLHQASRIEPYDVGVQWQLCITQAFLVQPAGVEKECGRIGDIQPGNPMQYYGRSYFHLFSARVPEYLYWQAKGFQADPEDPELAAGAALAWLDLGDMQQAEDWLHNAASIDPGHPFIVSSRILFLLQQEQVQQAVDIAQKAYADQLPGRQGSDEVITRVLVGDAIARQDFAAALGILHDQLADDLNSPLESTDPEDAALLASMAYVLKLQNPASEQVSALLDHADSLNARRSERIIPFEKPFRQAMIESARGDRAAGIAQLRHAFELGWRWDWRNWLQRDFQFQPLHQEPEYKKLVAQIEQDMEQQRLRAYELLELQP